MWGTLGVVGLALGVVVVSIFLLGLGTLLKKGRCSLGACGGALAGSAACDGCPSETDAAEPPRPMEV